MVCLVYHSLNVFLKDVELHRKYEAIYQEFSGAGMPLKHFIVRYMKCWGLWVDVGCALGRNVQEPLQQQEKHQDIPPHFILSLHTHTTCLHAHTHLCGWTELPLSMLPCIMPLCTAKGTDIALAVTNPQQQQDYFRATPQLAPPSLLSKYMYMYMYMTCLAPRPRS